MSPMTMLSFFFHEILEQNKLVTFRGCQLDGGKTDVCETVKKKGGSISIEFCETCKEDGCNKSSTHFTKLWLLLIPMILVKNLSK